MIAENSENVVLALIVRYHGERDTITEQMIAHLVYALQEQGIIIYILGEGESFFPHIQQDMVLLEQLGFLQQAVGQDGKRQWQLTGAGGHLEGRMAVPASS